MEMNPCGQLAYQAQDIYPEVRCGGKNHHFAQAMLDNIGGGNSEMTAIAGYMYDNLLMQERPEIATAFYRIMTVEMHHLQIFGALAHQLGEDPRLWSVGQGRRSWWSPGYLQYKGQLGPMLRYAVQGEKGAIRKYRAQMRWITDPNVQENLRCITADEEKHLAILTCLYDNYVGKN